MSNKYVRYALVFLSVLWGGLSLPLLWSGPAAAVDYNAVVQHTGEKVYHRALTKVENINSQMRIWVGTVKLEDLSPDSTMSYCGKEMSPTLTNLTGMIGKPFMCWITYGNKSKGVIHRLEFLCE